MGTGTRSSSSRARADRDPARRPPGSGKTTAAAKLALLLRKEDRAPALVAADLQRPAAVDQLKLGRQIQIGLHRDGAGRGREGRDPAGERKDGTS